VAEEVRRRYQLRPTVGISGTGGGFQNSVEARRTSTTPRADHEDELRLQKAGIDFIELPIATMAWRRGEPEEQLGASMTVEETEAAVGAPRAGKVTRWNQVRPSWTGS